MTGNNAIEIIKRLFSLALTKYHLGLETSMKGSNFGFDSIIDGMS